MAVYEKQSIRYNKNEPSFSSSLLDSIYRSIDQVEDFHLHRKKNNSDIDAESLRRAIMIDKWIDNNYSNATPRHLPSNSGSSTDSSTTFSSTETGSSVSKSTRKSEKSRAPIKTKKPISPGGKIANFLNSIFSPRASQTGPEEWSSSVIKSRSVNGKSVNVTKMSSVIKSRSVNDTKTTKSCLNRNQFSGGGNKSKRSVRFVDEDCRPAGDHKSIYNSINEYSISSSGAAIGSQYIKKNIDSLRKHELRDYNHKEENDFDGISCASSDLFELENIGGRYEEDQLPVYGTTCFRMNSKVIW
ncbi:hypothetical protein CASFOL_030811 [Castilleja foliolosa]|uniref:Protein BIG GRAIN 1-like B n=1 Tax=Castilleja foliolosa TaxID=1961234 RepID=A0ABD3C701_9LAMI